MSRWNGTFRFLKRSAYAGLVLLDLLLTGAWIGSHHRRDDVSRSWPVSWLDQPAPTTPPNTKRHEANSLLLVSSGAGVLGVTRATTEHAITFDVASIATVATWNHDVRPPSMPAAGDDAPLTQWGLGFAIERTPWQRVVIGSGEQMWNRGWSFRAACPYWMLVLPLTALLAIMPARRLFSRRRQWLRAGMCGECGYDLRAHAPGQRCPECGAVIAAPRGVPVMPAVKPGLRFA